MAGSDKFRTTILVSDELWIRFKVAVIQNRPRVGMSEVLEFYIDNFLRRDFSTLAFSKNLKIDSRNSADKKPRTVCFSFEHHERFRVAVTQMSMSMAEVLLCFIDDFLRNESPVARLLRTQQIGTANSILGQN